MYGLRFYDEHVLTKPWPAPGLVKPPKSQHLVGYHHPQPTNLARLETQEGPINSLAFSPDSKQLSAGSWKKTVSVWNLAPAFLAAEACRTANRNLTCAEWQQHIGPDIPYRKTCEALPVPQACK